MYRYFFLACFLAAGLAACSGAAATADLTPGPPSALLPTETKEPPRFRQLVPGPVFTHGGAGSWFGGAVEPGAVIRHDGMLHMFFNGFTGWPAQSGVGHAVSVDGSTWTLAAEEPVLDSAQASFDGFTFFVSSVIELGPDAWAMYLYTLDEGRDGAPGGILQATASSPDGPWMLVPGFALEPGETGAWDGSRVTQPHVLMVGGEYRMYFAGYENDRLQGGRAIGIAYSEDGLTWEKRPEPVFSPSGEPGGWDAHRVFQPRVLAFEDGFLMLYKANVSVGRAEAWGFAGSPDGLEWERYPGNPLIGEDTYGIELRRNGIAELVSIDGDLFLFLEILEREGGGYHHGNAAYGSNIYLFSARLVDLLGPDD